MQNFLKSIWLDSIEAPSFDALSSNLQADVVVVGAGITGITTAYLLAKQGVKVIVLETDKLGSGCTAFSTGHLTSSLDADYSFVSSTIGKETARKVAFSMQNAINFVEQICKEENIECDFVRLSAYQYTEDENSVSDINDEGKASIDAGLNAFFTNSIPLPFSVKRAFEIKDQGEFNALKYIYGLAKCIVRDGGQIFEGTFVTGVDDNEPCVVSTKNGFTITAKQVVLATHTPIEFNVTQAEMIPYRSYVVTAKVEKDKIGKGLYWDILKHYHYIRTYEMNGENYIIIGGEDHKVGESNYNENESFERLEFYARAKFGLTEFSHRWSSEYFESADGLPYIGRSPFGKNKFIATGFTGDGLTFGVVSGLLLSDLLTGKENVLAKVYAPNRLNVIASAKDWVEENLSVMYHLVKDRFSTDASETTEVPKGEGRLVRVEGKQLAVYRDENDKVHAFSPVCSHMKCIVQWNNSDKSWDCPCHGARFEASTGEVLNGPAVHALSREQITAEAKKM